MKFNIYSHFCRNIIDHFGDIFQLRVIKSTYINDVAGVDPVVRDIQDRECVQ